MQAECCCFNLRADTLEKSRERQSPIFSSYPLLWSSHDKFIAFRPRGDGPGELMGSLSVLSDVVDQCRNDAFRVLKRLAGLRSFNLLPQVLFFRLVKGDELDAGPVP